MRRSHFLLPSFVSLALVASASATLTNFSDDFETGFNGPNWPKWPTATDHLNSSNNRSHLTGTLSVRQDPEDPATLANYRDFGTTAGSVDAKIWLWDDNSAQGTSVQPVNFYFGLYGDAGAGLPTTDTDHQLIGVTPVQSNFNTFSINSKSGGISNTGVTRTTAKTGTADGSGWELLEVQADALTTDGGDGQVRFYINNNLVGTSSREAGVNLRYLFMGSQSKNYEFFWYDDVSVTPEPASLSLLALGAGGLLMRRRRTA